MKGELFRFLRRAIRDGLWPLFQRYRVFPRILDQPMAECSRSAENAVHVLVCEKDAVMLHWCLRSLLLHSKTPLAVYIHDDGTCDADTLRRFQSAFADAKVLTRSRATEIVEPKIAGYPEIVEYRRKDPIAAKCIDFYLTGDEPWIIILDADVLFFADPKELFAYPSAATWMEDCFYSPWIEPKEAAEKFGCSPRAVSGGLGRMPRDSFDPALLGEVVRFKNQPHVRERAWQRGLPPFEDQTYHALRAARLSDARFLGRDYQVMTEPGLQGVTAKHYTTPFRFWLYEEGIPRVAKQLGIPLSGWLRERP